VKRAAIGWLGATAALAACGVGPNGLDTGPAVASITINPADTTVDIGATWTASATPRDVSGAPLHGHHIVWSSDTPNIVRVDTTGHVTTLLDGIGHVSARTDTVTATAVVHVNYQAVSSIVIQPHTLLLVPGDSTRLTAVIRDGRGIVVTLPITWASSDTTVAAIDARGEVSARAIGSVVLSAVADVKRDSAVASILVPAASVTITPDSSTLEYLGEVQLSAVIRDSAGAVLSDRPVTWTSVPGGPVSVQSTGLAQWAGVGRGTITAAATGTVGQAVVVARPLALVALAAGDAATCGIDRGGVTLCWGRDSLGALGHGSPVPEPSVDSEVLRPLLVTGSHRFTQLAAGGAHVCGLAASGAAYCWGWNKDGQLGAPSSGTCTDPCSRVPLAVQGGRAFVMLSAGAHHTCGLIAGGAAFCWGGNQFGQLGDSTLQNRSAPVAVAGAVAFTSITAGTSHTCGLTAGGAAYCWGLGELGALGIGADTGFYAVPQPVAGGIRFTSLSAGGNTTCGRSTGGDTYCWGVMYGATDSVARTPTVVSGAFSEVQAGENHYCGLIAGTLLCWGHPPLGDGTNTGSDVPEAIDLGQATTAFSVGGEHTCVITADGRTSCWGHVGKLFLAQVYFLLPTHIIAQG
jgi:uncharacterized protein YjdB